MFSAERNHLDAQTLHKVAQKMRGKGNCELRRGMSGGGIGQEHGDTSKIRRKKLAKIRH
jgi:hypothetical protein